MRLLHRPLGYLLALSLLVSSWISALAQTQDFEYFDQTGHNVQGEFLQFYRQAPNPTLLYGYPITEEFTRSGGPRVQYFQRARFEYHPEFPAGQRVLLTPLGADTYTPAAQVNIYSQFACRYYAAGTYPVCFEFMEFFDANGGVAQFGLPISPFEYHQDTLVQYFQNARLEWQPWKEPGQRVVITDLGRIYFDRLGEDPGLLPPSQPMNAGIEPLVRSIQLHAFVEKAVVLPADRQSLYIIARDQRGQPLSNADCTSTIQWPDGRTESALARTDRHGLAALSLTFSGQPQGRMVVADVTCTYRGLIRSSRTSFRIWY